MRRRIEYQIKESEQGLTVEQYLRRKRYSRQNIAMLKWTKNSILLDGRPAMMKQVVMSGQFLMVLITETKCIEQIPACELPFPVVYEDEDLVVVNKPSGMPSQPSWYYRTTSLASAAAWYYRDLDESFVYRCVNRLDKDTTGLIILARHAVSGAILNEMHQTGEMQRTYYAIAMGTMPKEGQIDLPIGKDENSPNRYQIDFANGLRAVTKYQVLKQYEDYSLLEIKLETGRTHQIRVHMQAIGHPLLGDPLYNQENTSLKRQALHAGKIEFVHPINGEKLCFYSTMPEDMQKFLKN